MRRTLLLRLGGAVPILLGVSLLNFLLLRALPGDFTQAATSGSLVTGDALENMRATLHLDDPILVQFWAWLTGVLRGDFGLSFSTSRPVGPELLNRLLVTGQLTFMAMTFALVLGTVTGLMSARMRGRTEWMIRAVNGLFVAVPNFVLATLVVLVVGLYVPGLSLFNYVPFFEDPLANISSLLLPAACMALALSVIISENIRAAVLEISHQDYILIARAKGLRPRTILWNYMVRNAITPVITVTGLQIATLLGGSILIETIFAVPGMGQLLFEAVRDRDYPVLQAIVLVIAAIVIVVNLLVDLAYARADARVSYAR